MLIYTCLIAAESTLSIPVAVSVSVFIILVIIAVNLIIIITCILLRRRRRSITTGHTNEDIIPLQEMERET